MTDDQEVIKKYQNIIRDIEEYEFYHTSIKTAQEVIPEVTQTQIIIFKDFDEKTATLLDSFMKNDRVLKDFLSFHMFPTVNGLTHETLEKVLSKSERKGVFLFRSEDDPKHEEYDREFERVATEMKSKDLLFFCTDIKGSLEKQIAETLGIDASELPVLQNVEMVQDTMMYRHSGEITEKAIKDFMERWKQNALPRYYTSEPIPKENPGPVYKVVGKSFVDEVINNDKSVLVRYYAPWCEFSGMLEPIFKKIAAAMQGNDKIKFCEIDSSKNDIEGYPFEGYPVIKFFPAGKKDDPLYYDYDFTEEALIRFVQENTNLPVILPPEPINDYIKPDL